MEGIVEDLEARDLVANITDRAGLSELLARESISLYAGYDPTSSSLHVGNLVPTIMLRRFQLAGHRPIVVVGGATGMVGDPSGKSDERNLLDEATLATNLGGIRAQLDRLFDGQAVIANNYEWTKGVSFLEFLRDTGKHLTINYMLAKDSVSARMEAQAGISYTEFSYMLLQAFDFVQLAKSHACRLQVGGNDQYGNITAGCELSRKMGGAQLFGLTAPLLLDSSGQKMGKTSTGERIWLDPERTSPYAFYQYWLGRPDAEMRRLVLMFSLRPVAELEELLAAHAAEPHKRAAQRHLAEVMTAWVHGADGLAAAQRASEVMFGGDLAGVTDAVLRQLVGSVPSVDVPRGELEAGINVIELLIKTPLATSKNEARKLVAQGGAYANGAKLADPNQALTLANLTSETMLVLRKGKGNYCLVRVV